MKEMLSRIGNYTGEELAYLFACSRFRWTKQESRKCAVLVNGAPKSGTTWMLRMLSSIPQHNLGGANGWYRLARSWLDQNDIDICVVKYEDLSTNTLAEMGRVFRFLGLHQDERLISSIINRNRFERLTMGKKFWTSGRQPGQEDTESHFRKGVIGDWKNHFEQTHVQRFKEIAGEALVRLGYEQDNEW
jgi:hypothetical protein